MKIVLNTKMVWLLVGLTILIVDSCSHATDPQVWEVSGIITDKSTGKALSGAKVSIEDKENTSGNDGRYSLKGLSNGIKAIRVTKDGFSPANEQVEISDSQGPNIEKNISMTSGKQVTFDPENPLAINANEKARTLTLTNIGGYESLRITATADPNAQWLTVIPQDPTPIILDKNKNSTRFSIAVDSKGLNLGSYSTKILFEYRVDGVVVGSDNYQVNMSVTTLSVSEAPVISNVLPQSGGYAIPVTITGQNFETDTSRIQVLFEGNKKAIITSATRTELKVKVPVGAKTGSIKVKIGVNEAVSNATFTYNLTCLVSTIAELRTSFYINDITTAPDGTIFLSGVEIKSGTDPKPLISRSALYRINRGESIATAVLEREAGYVNGSASSTAKLVNPTKLIAVNNDLYIVDQYDASIYRANYSESYASIRRFSNGEITAPYKVPLTDRGFIRDLLYIPTNNNGILFTDGTYRKYGLDGSLSEPTSDQGLTVALDFNGADVYSLDLDPADNPSQTTWYLRQRRVNALGFPINVASRPLGTLSTSTNPDNFPKGMSIDPLNQCAYIFDKNSAGNYIIYRVGLNDKNVETIYNGPRSISIYGDDILAADGSRATFATISCLTYDATRQAILLIDVKSGVNKVRSMECK